MASDDKSRNIPLFIVLFTLLIVISLIIAVYSFTYFFTSREYTEKASSQNLVCSGYNYYIRDVTYEGKILSFTIINKNGASFSSLRVFTKEGEKNVTFTDLQLVPEQRISVKNMNIEGTSFSIIPGDCDTATTKKISLVQEE